MLEESIPAVWASMNSWFTPTLLFVFLNLMIGTIFVASGGFGTQKHNQETHNNNDDQQHRQLVRSPSLLQRVKSINLYRYKSQELNPFSSVTTTTFQPSELEHTQQILDSFNIPHEHIDQSPYENLDEIHDIPTDETSTSYHNLEDHHVTRTVSDTKPASGDMPVKLSKKMRKSASAKSTFAHFEEAAAAEEVVNVRPSTVRESKSKANDLQSFGDDEEVDAKADDFINKFKNQLKLQRLNSIIRYKEMLGRGADK